MPIALKADIGYTGESIEFFERYKEAFGNVTSAEMISKPEDVNYKLILTNERNEQIIFDGGLTAGYSGEGQRGTYKVLKECGFDVNEEYIIENSAFKLEK